MRFKTRAPTRQIFVTDRDDEPGIRRSTQKIADQAGRENAAFVVYGRDTDQPDRQTRLLPEPKRTQI